MESNISHSTSGVPYSTVKVIHLYLNHLHINNVIKIRMAKQVSSEVLAVRVIKFHKTIVEVSLSVLPRNLSVL